MKTNNFVAFIITHGRPDNVKTHETLRNHGYNGPIVFVLDNTDKTLDKYIERYGSDSIVVFDKAAIAQTTDQGDNFNNLRTTTHARNAVFDIAKDLGYTYFIVLDDDYVDFRYRFDSTFQFFNRRIFRLDEIFDCLLEWYIKTPSLLSIAMAQAGEYIGGPKSELGMSIRTKRKAMNSFICSTERPFKFFSRLNEDVNTYTVLGNRGSIFLTLYQVFLTQLPTQSNSGGMTEAYLDSGTYVKSFYSVMYQPSSVKVTYQVNMGRLHHIINWKCTVPMILPESYRKRR